MTSNLGEPVPEPLFTEPVRFSINNERECNWIYNYLCSSQFNIINRSLLNYKDRKKEINQSISLWDASPSIKELFVSDTLKKCSEALIPEREFEWIGKQNKRLYRWLHAYLATFHGVPLNHNITFESYRRDIVTFFDNYPVTQIEKKELMGKLQDHWDVRFRHGDTFQWLDGKNVELVKWAWTYLESNKKISHDKISFIDETEKYDGLTTMLDLWDAHVDTKKRFIDKMKKALSQKKQRDKQDGKKAYNIVMSEDIKQKLNDVAELREMKINQTLEYIINKEYERVLNE
jgi:hypothetical protein